ncbi:MAG: MBL fold metallo-hydrolase [Geminicoccales bacterium]
MRVTLFGTRGSVATPGPATARYGGNTSTVEIISDNGTVLILDAGTGLRRLGERLPADTKSIDILLTHLHMDHIQGLGFFHPLTRPDIDVHIWGPPSSTHSLKARLSRYLSPPLFPLHFRDLPAVTCHESPTGEFEVGPFSIRASLVCHPDATLGYRISLDGRAVAYIPDHEPALCQTNGAWLEASWISGHELALNVDLLLHDAQYSEEEYASCVGYGHSSYRHAFDFAAIANVSELVPFHHDPSHDDRALDRLFDESMLRFKPDFKVSKGYEGAVFELGKQPS